LRNNIITNPTLFRNRPNVPSTKGYRNASGGKSYKFEDEQALCQYVVTGTFNQTFYTSAGEQLDKVAELCKSVSSKMLAKSAVYGHQQARMKDVPAYLLAVLAARSKNGDDDDSLDWLKRVFNQVITNTKMLCNFVQIVRSGQTGRRSFGTAVKRLIQDWLVSKDNDKLFKSSIGHSNPSLADIIKMVRPRPTNASQNATFGYLLGKEHRYAELPQEIKNFEAFKVDNNRALPNVPFRALTNCKLSENNWREIALNMPWNTLRMNLNMLEKNGVFNDNELTDELARRLSDPDSVRLFNAFPYQLLTTYHAVNGNIPAIMTRSLQDALEVATENIPTLDTDVAVCIDLSGSMYSPVTGYRQGSTTATTCVDVAALVAASLLRTNEDGCVIAWASDVMEVSVNTRDSVLTNTEKFKTCDVGCGTCAELGLRYLNQNKWKGDAVIYVSDNQSWMNSTCYRTKENNTVMAEEWKTYVKRNPRAKLVCIDIQPYGDTQVPDSDNVLNIGGFSDAIWKPIANFIHRGDIDFVEIVRSVEI
jgi:60 kDa SS-A/Ro ribonucleoprotein